MSRAWKWNKETRLYDPIEMPDEEAMNVYANYGPRGRELWQNRPDFDREGMEGRFEGPITHVRKK